MKPPRLSLVSAEAPEPDTSDASGAPRRRRYVVLLSADAAARLEAVASDACREPEQQLEFYARRALARARVAAVGGGIADVR